MPTNPSAWNCMDSDSLLHNEAILCWQSHDDNTEHMAHAS